ncbi:four helix bundle suffix domain-containing protein [uncultured Duncaniella sp.]|uniref:four helix bundle suffix domain-containing protein n=1 Tax=uncultured Duncaniella sp. TaxID=2768039 RepID=UPI0025EC2CD5|nr:four helix bundle suffix domain-containing protein [uncultured Duncaniella sp.]
MPQPFLPQRGNYRNLIAYQKAECIYDITFFFANKFLSKGDRTVDQMIQAARSGKQNIAEGSAASTSSRESEIKLLNVARASFQELLVDYEDFLRVRGLLQWPSSDMRSIRTRQICYARNESSFYREAIQVRSPETIANIAITLIHQEDVMLRKLIEKVQQQFLQDGGIREQMTHARLEYRKRNGG